MDTTKIWSLSFHKSFEKKFSRLSHADQKRILEFLEYRVFKHEDPKKLAKSLSGNLSGYWRFRVGDYRIIADIQEDTCIIIAIDVGHRREIYS